MVRHWSKDNGERKTKPALRRPDAGEVRAPFLVRSLGGEVLREEVRRPGGSKNDPVD
jgi:hypothetical protein